MCIQTRIERAQAQKAALDAQILKLESLEIKTAPVKSLLTELLADYSDVAPEDLAVVWQEILAIGQKFGLSVQPLAADELKQWEAALAENARLKQQLEEAHTEITEQDRSWGELSDERDDLEKELAELRSQMPTPTIRAEYELATGNDASELSEAQCQQQLEVWEKETQAPVITEEEAHELETIPALTLWQPWATLIAEEVKRIETRSWPTTYRGPIAIHAAKKPVDYFDYPHLFNLLPTEHDEMPFGAVVVIANLIDCVQMTPEFIAQQSETELKCGDWKPGRFAWVLEIIRPVVPPIPATGGQKLWSWSGTSVSAEFEYLEKLKTALEPEGIVESTLTSHGFFMPDINLGDCYDQGQKYEDYRGWEIYYSQSDQEGPIDGIGLYNEAFGFWDASTEMIGEDDPTFPQSFTDYNEIVAWTRKVIDKVVAVTSVESSEVPGQLALEFPETEVETVLTDDQYDAAVEEELALDDEIPELGGNWEKVIENYNNAKPTELQKVLFENDSSFVFEPAQTGGNVKTFVGIHSQITPADDTVDFATEEARFDVAIFEGGFQGDYEKAEYFLDAQTFLYHHRADIRQAALGYAKYFWQELEKKAEIKEKVAHWNADKTLPPNQPASEPIAESANTEPAQLETVAEAPTQESKFKVGDRLRWDDPEDENDTSRSQGLAGSINRITKLGNICWTPDGSTIERILPLPMAERVLSPIGSVKSELPKSETDTEFEAMGLHVIVYPSYGNGELVGATFRVLTPEEMGADGKPRLVFATSLLAAEMGELPYKVVAEQLIMNYQAKEADRLEKLANPYKKPEDDFIEFVRLTPAVGYIKRRDNGELISAYAAFANRDAAGEKTETLAKPRAKKWKEFWHNSFESCGWRVDEPRKVKRMQSEPGAKQVFAYEIKITGKFSIGQLQKLAEEDFSLLPNEIAAKPVEPVTAPAPNFRVIVNGFEMASGKNEEVLARFEEELAEFGDAGKTSVSLMRGSEVVERYAVADFNFIEAQDFDSDNPEYFVLHRPTQINLRVYRSITSGAKWVNSICPHSPLDTKEAAAVDGVRRKLKAEKAE